MAAKVVIVAVPTVLSIASIRVYTVREAPTEGLVTREKLNIYTPLPQSAQAQFVPERPGVIQSGLTTARESILPFYLAVKGACFSVKRGSVNLYHAGEDMYYYLKDPPPEFLPRFGTITMAGLLGMFLARKGSRFRRLAVPLGLMSTAASVCYPAQAVAVLKVTGKKVYAAGRWSSAAVSSLFTPKPQEAVTRETAASQPQAATVPNPESAAAEEETSSVTLAEISPDQTPTESSTVALSVPAETNTSTTSEEIPAPVEGEEPSNTKQAAEDVSPDDTPAESTPSLELETLEAAPPVAAEVEAVPAEAAEVEAAPTEAAPAGAVTAEAAPAVAAEVKAAPAEAAEVEAALVESAPAEAAPAEAAPAEAAEVESVPSIEEPPASEASDEPAVPVVESAEPEPAPHPELADPPQVAAVEETPTPTLTAPPQQPAAEDSKGGSGFKPDPALMDFGQSNPEDEDLYSTRS
ncbi:MICOS complex subunit MIC27 [Chelmon rostratus]|uniref:MICOS complex subunit MIC27 n=1 Tax=Chelmon rostratus TaxID=109905 RepID=UPI001BEA84F4|nr:MICOS complex subunit MIC27 [Chelmon rostratus]